MSDNAPFKPGDRVHVLSSLPHDNAPTFQRWLDGYRPADPHYAARSPHNDAWEVRYLAEPLFSYVAMRDLTEAEAELEADLLNRLYRLYHQTIAIKDE